MGWCRVVSTNTQCKSGNVLPIRRNPGKLSRGLEFGSVIQQAARLIDRMFVDGVYDNRGGRECTRKNVLLNACGAFSRGAILGGLRVGCGGYRRYSVLPPMSPPGEEPSGGNSRAAWSACAKGAKAVTISLRWLSIVADA